MTSQDLIFCKQAEVSDYLAATYDYVETLCTTDNSFCYKLHKLKKVMNSLAEVADFFGRQFVNKVAIVVDITQLHKSYFGTKGSELLRDLIYLIKAPYADDLLKVIIVYNNFIPGILTNIGMEAVST